MTGKTHVVRSFKRPFFWTTALICIPGFLGGALVFAEFRTHEALASELTWGWALIAPFLIVCLLWSVLAWVVSPVVATIALFAQRRRTAAGIAAGFCVSTVVGLAYIGVVFTFIEN